ncbi:UDP-Glycosyltransferase/glycogen phosphorylase [Gigaspora margarita]|uniref:UDP-Glycosyltransferase/glycogen phosphorylase n=1 Tax=Gigaspora margarita TaxID=4874 RepID=A0A8H4AUG1_GIGMA|nr:UDP-Glycosyltransferase/glycogen phosphorylase [Gigaspora margarita]
MIGTTHLRHMLEICLILMDRGYNVTLIAPGNYTAQSVSYRSIPQIIFENKHLGLLNKSSEFNKAYFDDDHGKVYSVCRKAAVQSYVSFYNIYKQIAEEINVDLFFCDYLMNYPCFDLAWKLGKPAVESSSDHNFLPNPPYISDPIYDCHVNMENESFYNRFKCAIIVPLKDAWSVRDYIKNINAQRALVGVDPHWDIRGRVSTILKLSNNFFGFDIPRADTPLHQEIGPVLPDIFPGLTPDLDSFLATHPRTLYFALGTNVFIPPQSVINLLKSFLELIKQDIIDGVIWSTLRTDVSESFQLANSSSQISNILNNEYPHIHYEGIEDENGRFKINNENLLRDWITPDSRMGFIRGNYLDVYAVAILLFLALSGGFGYALWKIARYSYIKFRSRYKNYSKDLKHKRE